MWDWYFNWKFKKLGIAHDKQRKAMIDVINKHGMKAHMYFPSVRHRENIELSTALDWFAANGFIVTDENGDIVGKVATANMDSVQLAEIRRAEMKLVGSDTGSDSK